MKKLLCAYNPSNCSDGAGMSSTRYNIYSSYLISMIEEELYLDIPSESPNGVVRIHTVVPKYCFGKCISDPTGPYEVCGEGCCIRNTGVNVENGEITNIYSHVQDLVGGAQNNICEPVTPSCSIFDCNLGFSCDGLTTF